MTDMANSPVVVFFAFIGCVTIFVCLVSLVAMIRFAFKRDKPAAPGGDFARLFRDCGPNGSFE